MRIMQKHLKTRVGVALHDDLLFSHINILMARTGRLGIPMDLKGG